MGQEHQGESGDDLFSLVIIPALMLSFSVSSWLFRADVDRRGGNLYTAYARPLLIIVSSLAIAAIVQLIPQRALMTMAALLFLFAFVFARARYYPLGRARRAATRTG